jgi:hypothetical protein
MKPYQMVEVLEQQLEDLVRLHAGMIEEGLVYVDHQKRAAGGRLDVLMVDSGRALVVAELKVVQDDGMLLQGLDYYDDVSGHAEAYARLYKDRSIDPTQDVRLLLIAPSFSQATINRCKWLDVPVSLFTFKCLKFEGECDLVPVFSEQSIPTRGEKVEVVRLEDHLAYITDIQVRELLSAFLQEMEAWRPGAISTDPVKNAISIKIKGRVFAYIYPRRQSFLLGTYDASDVWTEYPVRGADDLDASKPIARAAMERRVK